MIVVPQHGVEELWGRLLDHLKLQQQLTIYVLKPTNIDRVTVNDVCINIFWDIYLILAKSYVVAIGWNSLKEKVPMKGYIECDYIKSAVQIIY